MKIKSIILLYVATLMLATCSVGYGAQKTPGYPSTIKKSFGVAQNDRAIAPLTAIAVDHLVNIPQTPFATHCAYAKGGITNKAVKHAPAGQAILCILGVIGCFRRDPGDEQESSAGGGPSANAQDDSADAGNNAGNANAGENDVSENATNEGTAETAEETTDTTETASTPAPADIPTIVKTFIANSAEGADDPREAMIKSAGWLSNELNNVLVSSAAGEPTKTLLGMCVKSLKGVVEDTLTAELDAIKTA